MPRETLIEEARLIGANSILWSRDPILKKIAEQNYHGRVFVEVWAHEGHLAFTNHCEKEFLKRKALDALQREKFMSVSADHLTDEPATGPASGTFIGRVIVEVWDALVVIGITGKERRVLLHRIRDMLRVRELLEDTTLVPLQR